MDKLDYLHDMIKYRKIWIDNNIEYYGDAHENYFENLVIDDVEIGEIKLLIKSFSNKTDHPYVMTDVTETIFFFLKRDSSHIGEILDDMFDRVEGYFEMYYFLKILLSHLPQHMEVVMEKINSLDRYRLLHLRKIFEYAGINYSNLGVFNKLRELTNLECRYTYIYIPYMTELKISDNDIMVLDSLTGYSLNYGTNELQIICDEKRLEVGNLSTCNIIGVVKNYNLIEKDGFYYIRNRDQLNEDVFDVPVGNSLEKVLENGNLFSWIK